MKHTPGPWFWNGVATIWNTRGKKSEVEREVIIAQAACDYRDNSCVAKGEELDANCMLIAAAPQLLQACQLVLEEAEQQNWDLESVALQTVITALSKATGDLYASDERS